MTKASRDIGLTDQKYSRVQDVHSGFITVDRQTYKTLYRAAGGLSAVALAIVAMLVFVAAGINLNYFLLHWAHSRRSTQDNYAVYCSVIFATAAAIALVVFLWINTLMCLFQRASRELHNKYLNIIFRAPVNTFWKMTSSQKVLGRFNKDLQEIDEILWLSFSSFSGCVFISMSVLIVCSLAFYWMLLVVTVFACGAVYLFVYSAKAIVEAKKIEQIQLAAMLSHM